MRYSMPPPTNRKIRPSLKRRIVFALVGVAAVLVRLLTAPWRAKVSHSRKDDRPVFLYEPYGMGDVLALQPLVVTHLATGRRVILASRPQWSEIIPPHPRFTFVPVSPKYASTDPAEKYQGFIRDVFSVARTLRVHAAGSEGIDVRGDVRSLVILYLAGCGSVHTLPRYYTANDCLVMPFAAHRVPLRRDVSRRLLNGAFAPAGAVLPRSSVNHLLPSGAVMPDSRRVGLIPLTPWEGKRWIPELWRETIHKLKARGFQPVVLCGPKETDDAIQAVGGAITGMEFREADGVRKWVALLTKCGSVISVNTGPMHIADALDKPLVVLEGGSRLPLWAPEGDHAYVLNHQHAAGCAPCHQVGDLKKCHRRCMALTRPDEVMSALNAVLRSPKA